MVCLPHKDLPGEHTPRRPSLRPNNVTKSSKLMTRRTFNFAHVHLLNESMDDYAKRLQQLAEDSTLPHDNMFMLSNFCTRKLEYLPVATVGLRQ